LGALTITGDAVKREPAYYIIAHASKFVRPGSVRIESTYLNDLPNVAFKTQDGKIILIVLNDSKVDQQFTINVGGQNFSASIKVGAVETYVFFNKTIQESE
jgi:glucosylceramidase